MIVAHETKTPLPDVNNTNPASVVYCVNSPSTPGTTRVPAYNINTALAYHATVRNDDYLASSPVQKVLVIIGVSWNIRLLLLFICAFLDLERI